MAKPILLLFSNSETPVPGALAERLGERDWQLIACRFEGWRKLFAQYGHARAVVWLGRGESLPAEAGDMLDVPERTLAVVCAACPPPVAAGAAPAVLEWPRDAARLDALLMRHAPPMSGMARAPEAAEDIAPINFIGRSPAFRHLVALIRKMSPYDATVLIEGETGAGKELVARALHYLGARRNAPFVPVNCGAVPENLIESELFGHAKGAFTDAREARRGLVALAHKGTLFLDEVDALSPRAQVALLRFLQEREFRPVGSERMERVDVRIIAATNANLAQAVAQGSFRGDLLFRLNVLGLWVPPLRQRPEDIPLLAERFLEEFRKRYGKPMHGITETSLDYLCSYHWPGNVRELENVIHREFLLADDDWLDLAHPDVGRAAQERRGHHGDRRLRRSLHKEAFSIAKKQVLTEFERTYLVGLMQDSNGNVSLAARRAGKERRAFGRLLKKHNLSRDSFQP
ncbi:MAG: sigma-54 dependent transcriptional regulator [Pseudomonadota bacterium]